MRYFLIPFLLIGSVQLFNTKYESRSKNLLSRVIRQVSITQNDLNCESRVCKDCQGSCDGCDRCGLCGLIQTTCDAGLKELKLGDVNLCDRCAYCKEGPDVCKKKCLAGKKESTCQQCISNCPARNSVF